MGLIEIDWNPDERKLRWFAAIWLCVFGALGAAVAWKTGAFSGAGRWAAPVIIWAAAAAVGLTGIAAPAAVRSVYRAWMALGFPIGWVVSHGVLAIIYFGVFTPVALVFRLIGRDSMKRGFDRNAGSYWVGRGPPASPGRYFDQF